MSRRLLVLLGVPIVLFGGFLVAVRDAPATLSAAFSRPNASAPARSPQSPRAQEALAKEHAKGITCTVVLPSAEEALVWSGERHGPKCPRTQVSAVLGASIAEPHGIVLEKIIEGGPAEEGGLRPGDSIVECDGASVTCPSALLPHLNRGPEARSVELTVLRASESATEGESEERPQAEARSEEAHAGGAQ